MSDLLTIGSSGVGAYQRALATVSNNIANVSTEGYTRQDIALASNQPTRVGGGYIGTGVRFDAVRRQYDAFVESNLRNSNSDLESQKPLLNYVNRLIDVMGDASIGLTTAMNQFFESARDLSSDAASTISRSIFLRDADGLSARFRQLASQFDLLDNETRQSVQTDVGQINSFTQQLAQMNQQLSKNGSLEKQPSELLDQRDLLLRNLSGIVAIKTSFSLNGEVLVTLGDTNSQGFLVKADKSQDIIMQTSDGGALQINYRYPPMDAETGLKLALPPITSGKIGGVMSFRDMVLTPAVNSLNDLAKVMAAEVNAVHRDGIDAEGKLGGELFGFSEGQSGTAAGMQMLIKDANRVAAAGQFRVIDNSLNSGNAQARISYTPAEFQGPSSLTGQLSKAQSPQIASEVLAMSASQPYASVGLVPIGTKNLTLTLNNPTATQSFQVLTRDGRHLLGNNQDQSVLMKTENGLEANATYSNAYLNKTGTTAQPTYLGMDIFMGVKAGVLMIQQFNPATGSLTDPLAKVAQLSIDTLDSTWTGPVTAGTFTLNGEEMPTFGTPGTAVTISDVQAWIESKKADTKVTANLVGGKLVLSRTDNGTPPTGDIRLGLGSTGTPADLKRMGFDTTIHIEGNARDDLLVFVTDSASTPTNAKVTAQFEAINSDMKQGLRAHVLDVKFLTATEYEIRDRNSNTVLAQRELISTPGQTVPQIQFRGLNLEFSTAPKQDDRFAIDGNTDGIGNNEAMLKLVELEYDPLMPGGLTMTEAYIERVNLVGNVARQAAIAQQALEVVYEQAKETRDGISGVSLDEEASALVRFQQAYQANAKVMQTSMTLFDTIVQIR
jgi:flagellar hook-associated protein FlgK